MHVCITKFKTMSLKTLKTTGLLTLAFLAALSCKKEEETATLPYLEGDISIVGLEEFMDASTENSRTLRLKPSGAVHPEGKELGYCWKVAPLMTKFDTTRFENGTDKRNGGGKPSDGSFEYVIKDSLTTYTVYCYAFASGYTSSSAMSYTTLVKSGDNGSITNSGIYDDTFEIKGSSYRYITLGDRDWINSNVFEDSRYGVPFRNADPMSGVFGRYYNYEDAVNVCKSIGNGEWYLPTENDWINMVKWTVRGNEKAPEINEFSNIYWDKEVNGTPTIAAQLMVNARFNAEDMWTYWPAVGDINNRSGLAFLPTGYANLGVTPTPAVKSGADFPEATFEGLYDYSVFWTADEVEGEEDMAYYRYIFGNQPHFMIGKGNKKTFGASVRCVRKVQ